VQQAWVADSDDIECVIWGTELLPPYLLYLFLNYKRILEKANEKSRCYKPIKH
jgi:hypothetical protein